jgi:hypothetical protein
MQQIGHKKVIHRRIRDKICNPFDYMRITFPFEPLTKIGFLRIYFFNQFSESLNLPRHSFLRRLCRSLRSLVEIVVESNTRIMRSKISGNYPLVVLLMINLA